ncbi:hypothetical protein GCG54_00015362 [Colletotrichum gloeosporioides]|uniref:Uncharacterized protein n=1 Tax=Colletotrichum gloeosporioides TaxID=474922 RepID=A0A8H4FMW7_COLGL|nr:uncharacterized protein GCG54_00015362 [Colletotrichum gloeosporioides]KAF3807980.1 hypothetical protein GCG54_00015362 [Colletotrichum gloeosporioides]
MLLAVLLMFDTFHRRMAVSVLTMFGQQITGQTFTSQYNVIFYQSQGFGDQAFTSNMTSSYISLVGIMFVSCISTVSADGLFSCSVASSWLYDSSCSAKLGNGNPEVLHEISEGVSCCLLDAVCILLQPILGTGFRSSYDVFSETTALGFKASLFACVVSMLTTLVTPFAVPYLMNTEYANLRAKLGFVTAL